MSELLRQLQAFLWGAWRFRWPAIVTMWGIAIAGWVGVALIPNTYTSHARLYVDSDSLLKPLLNGLAVGTDVQGEVAVMSRILLSRPNMEKVARISGLDRRASTAAQKQAVVDSLLKRMEVQPSSDNIYSIVFTDPDRFMAQKVVQTVLSAFVEDALGVKRADADEAQRFLEQQIKEYEQKLHDAEDKLADFKRRNVGLMPSDSGDYYRRLQAAIDRESAVRSDYDLAVARRDELNRQLAGEEPTFGLAPSQGEAGGVATSVDAQLALARNKLDALLLEYTEKHPEVIAARETVARLGRQQAEEAAIQRKNGGLTGNTNPLNINPVYQSMRIALSQAQVQVIELRDKLGAAQREVAQLRTMVNTVPEVEANLAQLNRDYEVNRAQHQALLQRLESARLSDQANQSKDRVRFRVIEPPTLSLDATAPNRMLFNTGVLLLALLGGIALGSALDQMRPVFSRRSQLADVTSVRVLGAVSLISFGPAPGLFRRQPFLAGGAVTLLAVLYFVTLALSDWLMQSAHSALQ